MAVPAPDLSTVGWRGAAGFFRCAVTYRPESSVVATVRAVAPALSTAARMSDGRRDRGFEEWHAVKGRAQDLARARAQVASQDLLVDGAEVDRVLEVARAVEGCEAGGLTVKATLHRVADQEQGRRCPVIGASARVFLRAPAELRPRRDQHLVRHAMRREVLVEGADGRIEVAHQVVVSIELGVVRVEP